MKRLLFLVVVAGIAWYGWNHRAELFQHAPAHEVVVENRSGGDIERVRIKVDGQTLVKERVAEGQDAHLTFRLNRDSTFDLVWVSRGEERSWSGGLAPAGPMTQRYFFTIGAGTDVTYRAEPR
jgi:hypothetical protein